MYTVSVDNFQKLDQIRVFYYGFLSKSDQALYKKDKNIFGKYELDPKAEGRIKEINSEVSKKRMTEDGTERKEDIVTKIFETELKTLLQMNFFIYVLEPFQKYVKLFQRSEPLIHLLHEKQVELVKAFPGLFIKPEFWKNIKAAEVGLGKQIILDEKEELVTG